MYIGYKQSAISSDRDILDITTDSDFKLMHRMTRPIEEGDGLNNIYIPQEQTYNGQLWKQNEDFWWIPPDPGEQIQTEPVINDIQAIISNKIDDVVKDTGIT